MSCHYSCTTCISQLFADQCLSCPITRQLIDTTCLCASSYYQYQQITCRTVDQITVPDYAFNLMTQILYWIMLGFSWVIIVGNLNHLYSAKVRVLVGWSQLLALLLDYRFRFAVLSEKALEVFGVWNFRYLDKLFCSQKSKPYQCQTYQNLYGPLLTLGVFFVAMVVSFILTKTCILSIFTQQQQDEQKSQIAGQVIVVNRSKQTKYQQSSSKNPIKSMNFIQYMRISIKQFFFLYLDYTIIQWTLQLSRIAYASSYLFMIYIPIIVFLLLYSLYSLKIINSASQFKVEYRSQLGYFYIYDQKYYLNYLDYLFEEERLTGLANYQARRYLPHSSYLILQLFVKFLIASTTIVMFQYKPQLWVFPAVFALLVGFVKLKVFQIYQREALLCYFIGFSVYIFSVALFFVEYFFTIWILFLVVIVSAGYFVLLISELTDWTRAKQGKYWSVAFSYLNGQTDEEHIGKKLKNREDSQGGDEQNSHDQIIKSRDGEANGVIRSGQDVREKSDQQLNNVARNIIVNTTKPSFKKNINSGQKNSISNQNYQQSNIDINYSQNSQNIRPQSFQQSFMTRTNRSKFAGMNSSGNIQDTNSRMNGSQRNSVPNNRKKGGNDQLPEIVQDKQESLDGRSIEDVKRNTGINYAKGQQDNRIQQIDNSESDHEFNGGLNVVNSQQENVFKPSVKFNMRYKR